MGRLLTVDEVTVRPAQHADYAAVMAINTAVFFGNDYLHITYHDFLRDPRTHSFVAEVNGTVVGFECFYTDGPKQMIAVGARVHADYRGTVVFKKLITTSLDFMKAKFPDLEWRVFAAFDSDFYRDETQTAGRPQPIVIFERFYAPYWTVPRSAVAALVNDLLPVSASHQVQCFPQDQAISVLTEAGNQQRLFSTRHIVGYYNWLPQLLTPANIRRFVLSHRFRFTTDMVKRITAVSFSIPHKIPDGTVCCVHYYHNNNDTDIYIAHVLDHLTNAIKVALPGGKIAVSLRTPMDIDMAKVKEVFKPYLGDTRSDNNFRLGTGICGGLMMQPSKM